MSFAGNLFSKLGLGDAGMASLLPQYTSPPSRPVDEHYLAELSPRPEDALLPHDIPSHASHAGNAGSASVIRNGRNSTYGQNNRDDARVKASVTFQDPPPSPGRTGDAYYDYRAREGAYQTPEQGRKPLEFWSPSFAAEHRDPRAASAGPHMSFFESMFTSRPARPAYTERTPSARVDQSFKLIERRERQMQQDLQRLLDAQDYALEKHLANTIPENDDEDDHSTQRSGTPVSDTPHPHVIPVRQPKKRHLSKREARLGISRCMSQLSDLKNEEEAYIATALAERKAALLRLRNLSTKRNSIVAEMKTIESDRGQPLKNEISKMEQKHRVVCDDILKLEEKLRDLKRTKTRLETRITEAKSTRDSELSGYKGALNECDKCINDIMNYPDVSVLEVEGFLAQDADLRALVGQHISGFEFLSLRPERRTLSMAKDWWEGEVQVLEFRKTAVDKERGALDEGTQLWQNMLGRLEAHDRHLKLSFDAMAEYSTPKQRHSSAQFNELGDILKKQYVMCQETTHELEELYEYTESQGWNLLVTALGAEVNYFHGLKAQLADTLHAVGWADGVVTPRAGTPTTTTTASRGDNLLGIDDAKTRGLDLELSGSVLRRWDETGELQRSISKTSTSPHLNGLEAMSHEDSDGDNEVPPGLFSEGPHESDDDEHNDVPSEFLSMHSPLRRKRSKPDPGAGVGVGVEEARIEAETGPESQPGVYEDKVEHDEEDEERQHPLSRQSSANEVPPDLLAESHHTLD